MAVYRVKHELSFSGRSFCDKSKETLGVLDLIPVFSFLLTRGKCRHCNDSLPLVYPLTEIVSGITFSLSFITIIRGGIDYPWYLINLVIAAVYIIFFLFFAVYDYLYWEVNVRAIRIAIIFSSFVAVLSMIFPEINFPGISGILAGLIAGLVIAMIVKFTKGSGMGEGDIYLMAFAGMFVGLVGLIPLFMISSITGALVGIVKALKIGKLHGVQIQFVPFISFGALIIFLFKDEILSLLYLDPLINFLWL